MPHAFTLHLTPTTLQSPPLYLPRYAHGLFYHLLQILSPELSRQIHEAKTVPFTLGTHFYRGQLELRITLLDDTLFAPILKVILNQSVEGLALGQNEYTISRVLATPEGHPRSGRLNWQELQDAPPLSLLPFKFLSPTVFSSSGTSGKRLSLPLPEPRLILGSLLRTYQTFHPDPLGEAEVAYFKQVFQDRVTISDLKIHTEEHWAGKQPITGFKGIVALKYLDDATEVKHLLGKLYQLAFYSGVGAKTPYGMGQVDTKDIAASMEVPSGAMQRKRVPAH